MNPELPGTYVNLLVDVVKKWDISSERLLAGTGISSQKLNAPFWYVDFNVFNYLLEKAALLTKEPAISLYLAKEMKVSCYGHVGIAATASETLGDAIEVLEQFIGLHCSVFKPRLKIDEEMAYLYFNQPLQKFRLNTHGITFLVFGFAQIVENLVQHKLEITFRFQQDKPVFYKELRKFNGLNVSFGHKNDCLILKKILIQHQIHLPMSLYMSLSLSITGFFLVVYVSKTHAALMISREQKLAESIQRYAKTSLMNLPVDHLITSVIDHSKYRQNECLRVN